MLPLLEPLPPVYRNFVTKLDAQAVRGGIGASLWLTQPCNCPDALRVRLPPFADYRTLGQGWDHPTERLAYRLGEGRSFHKSAKRQAESRQRLEALAKTLASDGGGAQNEVRDAHRSAG